MATLRFKKDYNQYKKGDTFESNNASTTQYLVETGILEVVDKADHVTVANPEGETKKQQEQAEKAIVSGAKTAKK
jgi:hypothetical protein